MKKGLFAFLFFFIGCVFSLTAQVENPAKWTFSQKNLGNNEYELVFKAELDPGWTVYSMYTPEGGPMATTVTLNQSGKGMEVIGKAEENEPHKKYDDIFGVDVWYFSGEFVIRQRVKVTDAALASVQGTIEYQVCQEGQCVMFDEDFDIPLDRQQMTEGKEGGDAVAPERQKDESLWIFFWIAFVGGLAAVVMPCVFPMIPMTVSFFMHGDANKAKAKAKALFFSLSIIAIYTVLGLVISVVLGPDFINWLSTNWIPNLFFFIIFMILRLPFLVPLKLYCLPGW